MTKLDIVIHPLPNPDQLASEGKPHCRLLLEFDIWTHGGHISRGNEARAWRAFLGSETVQGLLQGKRESVFFASDRLGELVQQCLECPLAVTFHKHKRFRHWSLTLSNGMRVIVNASDGTPRVVTMFFSDRVVQRVMRSLLGTEQGDRLMFNQELEQMVRRYSVCTGKRGEPSLPKRRYVAKIRDKKTYSVNRIRFVLASNWGFESNEPGAKWQFPMGELKRRWLTGKALQREINQNEKPSSS